MIIARCTVRDRCHQNNRQHIVGNIVTAIYVRGHGSPNVQGRGQILYPDEFHTLLRYMKRLVWPRVNTHS